MAVEQEKYKTDRSVRETLQEGLYVLPDGPIWVHLGSRKIFGSRVVPVHHRTHRSMRSSRKRRNASVSIQVLLLVYSGDRRSVLCPRLLPLSVDSWRGKMPLLPIREICTRNGTELNIAI